MTTTLTRNGLDEGFVENILGPAHDPRPYYAELHRVAPVYRTPLDFWYVSSYGLSKEVYSNPDNWLATPDTSRADRSWMLGLWYKSLLSLDDPEHKRMRRFIASLGTRKFVNDLESAMRRVIADQWTRVPDGTFDFRGDFAGPIGMKVIMSVLGVDLARIDDFTAMSRTMHKVIDPTVKDEELRSAESIWQVAADAVLETAALRRSKPEDDIISELARLVDAGELTEDELVSTAFFILVAGNETSSASMTSGLYHLLANPELFQSIKDDRSLLTSAIEELLRYDAAARNSVPRYAARDLTLGGVDIAKGEPLYVCNHAANHDAAVFEKPLEIDLRRSPNRHIAFGFGVHHCLGAAVARLEMKVGFESVFERYSGMELVEPDVRWEAAFIRRALVQLPVRGVLAS